MTGSRSRERRLRSLASNIFVIGPETCPRCHAGNVVPGHTRGFSGALYPAWVCDWQNCGIAVCWRQETKPCGLEGCPNENGLAVVVLNA
jgi:hypothetical protein